VDIRASVTRPDASEWRKYSALTWPDQSGNSVAFYYRVTTTTRSVMRAPDEEGEEHRLTRANLALDPGGPALICKKCEYVPTTTRCQVTCTCGKAPNGLRDSKRPDENTFDISSSLTRISFLVAIVIRNCICTCAVHRGHVCRPCGYRTTCLDLVTGHVPRIGAAARRWSAHNEKSVQDTSARSLSERQMLQDRLSIRQPLSRRVGRDGALSIGSDSSTVTD